MCESTAGSNPALSATAPRSDSPLAALAPALLAHAPSGALAPVLGRCLARNGHVAELDDISTALTDGRELEATSTALTDGRERTSRSSTPPTGSSTPVPRALATSPERSPSGLWRRTGNAVRGNPSRVRIPPSPPHPLLDLTAHGCVGDSARSLTHLGVRSLSCSPPPSHGPHLKERHPSAAADRPSPALAPPPLAHAPRGALAPVLGAALARTAHERRSGTSRISPNGTDRGSAHGCVGESGSSGLRRVHRPAQPARPGPWRLRPRSPRVAPVRSPPVVETGVSFRSRARRGTSGALYLQSAPAGLNPLPRSPSSNAARRCDVEDRVPRSGEPRTVSGPEGSSTKRSSPGAAERPGPSRPSWWARGRSGRRRVHGTSTSLALDRSWR